MVRQKARALRKAPPPEGGDGDEDFFDLADHFPRCFTRNAPPIPEGFGAAAARILLRARPGWGARLSPPAVLCLHTACRMYDRYNKAPAPPAPRPPEEPPRIPEEPPRTRPEEPPKAPEPPELAVVREEEEEAAEEPEPPQASPARRKRVRDVMQSRAYALKSYQKNKQVLLRRRLEKRIAGGQVPQRDTFARHGVSEEDINRIRAANGLEPLDYSAPYVAVQSYVRKSNIAS
jgi:hypothetical protein